MSSIKSILVHAGAALAVAVAPIVSYAQWTPTRPIKLIVPATPAGGTDLVARHYANAMAEELKQPMVIEYKPGGGSSIGAEFVSKADPDGYTILIGATSLASLPIFRKTGLNPDTELTPISNLAEVPLALATPASSPWKTYDELVAYAKANPGKLSYAHQGSGTTVLFPETMKQHHKLDIVGVAYKSGGDVALSLLKKEVQLGFPNVARAIEDQKSGRIRILAVTGDKRLPELPQTPTLAELGMPNTGNTWIAIFGPKNLPAPIQARLEDASRKSMTSIRQKMAGSEYILIGSTSAELRDTLRRQLKGWSEMAKAAGIHPE